MATFTSNTRPEHYFMPEDPGERITQSFRGPRADSRATNVDRPATSLLGLNMDSLAYDQQEDTRHGTYGIARRNGLTRAGLGQSPMTAYDSDTIKIGAGVASFDYSGAVVVGVTRFEEATAIVTDSIEGSSGYVLPLATSLEAEQVSKTQDYFQALTYEDQMFNEILRKAENNPLVLLGNAHDNPFSMLVSPANRYFNSQGVFRWGMMDVSDDPLMPFVPNGPRHLVETKNAGDIRMVEDYVSFWENHHDGIEFGPDLQSVTVISSSGLVQSDGGETDFNLDLQVENMKRAAKAFANRGQTSEPMAAGFGGYLPWVLGAGVVLGVAYAGGFIGNGS